MPGARNDLSNGPNLTLVRPAPGAGLPAPDAERVLQRIEWTVARRLDGLLQGEYRSLFTGHGLDLAGMRPYQYGDDLRLIDWNVTARTAEPHVREYHEDREITAWLLIDTSASVDFGTARARKRDLAVDLAGTMASLLTRRGNRVGAVLFSNGVDRVVPPGGGRRQALAIVHELLRPDRAAARGETRLHEVLDRTAGLIRRRSLVVIVSDFISSTPWEPSLRRLAHRHELLAAWLHDPREEEFPDVGPLVLEDAESGEQILVDTHDRGFRRRFRALAEQRRQDLASTFARNGVPLLSLSTDRDLLTDLVQFAQQRRRSARAIPVADLPRPSRLGAQR